MKPRERRVSAWNCPQTRDTPNVPKDAVPQEKMPLSPAEDAPWPSTAVIVDHLSVIDQIEQVFKKVESSLNSRWTSINRLSLIVVTTNRHHQSLLFIKFKKKTWASLDSFGYRSYRVIVVEERKTVWQRVSFGRRFLKFWIMIDELVAGPIEPEDAFLDPSSTKQSRQSSQRDQRSYEFRWDQTNHSIYEDEGNF